MGDSDKSSPLLFFVALGFGIVFTNLWIIVAVKYCYRYRRRRQFLESQDQQAAETDGSGRRNNDIIAMTSPAGRGSNRGGRRRREKKLMSLDEVNEKFPVTRYNVWRAHLEKREPLEGDENENALARTPTMVTADGDRKRGGEEDENGGVYAGHQTTGPDGMSKAGTSVTTREVSGSTTQGCFSPSSAEDQSGVFPDATVGGQSPSSPPENEQHTMPAFSSTSSPHPQHQSLSSLNMSNAEDNKHGTDTVIEIHEPSPPPTPRDHHNHHHNHRSNSPSHSDSETQTGSDTESDVSSDDGDDAIHHRQGANNTTTAAPTDAANNPTTTTTTTGAESEITDANPDPADPDTCAICLDVLADDDDIRGLTCNHAFHVACLDPWLTNRRACCPLCKADYYTPKPRGGGSGSDPRRNNGDGRRRRSEQQGGGRRASSTVRGVEFPVRFFTMLYGPRIDSTDNVNNNNNNNGNGRQGGGRHGHERRRHHRRHHRRSYRHQLRQEQQQGDGSSPRETQNQNGEAQPQSPTPSRGVQFMASLRNRLRQVNLPLRPGSTRRTNEEPTPRELEANTRSGGGNDSTNPT